jgi:cysteine desulfurase
MSDAAQPVYLDHNATTRPWAEVVAAMRHALEHAWANPSSTHHPGQEARALQAQARACVARFLGCQAAEVVFTSGATEASHMAVQGVLAAAATSPGAVRRRLVISAVEHPALMALAGRLAGEGWPVDRIPVDGEGRLDMRAARALIGPDVAVVSVMGANNETGVMMPVPELAGLAHGVGARLHVDATQLIGKARFRFADSGADFASVSAHKLGGPKGIGALLVKKGATLAPLLCGRQERARRGGTENLPGIAGFAAACERVAHSLADDIARIALLRDRLEAGLRSTFRILHVYGAGAPRLANTLCVRFASVDSDEVLTRLERAGIVASSGSACSAGGTDPSHVLLAMGESAIDARAGVRFSLGPDTTAADIETTLDAAAWALGPLFAPADAVAA